MMEVGMPRACLDGCSSLRQPQHEEIMQRSFILTPGEPSDVVVSAVIRPSLHFLGRCRWDRLHGSSCLVVSVEGKLTLGGVTLTGAFQWIDRCCMTQFAGASAATLAPAPSGERKQHWTQPPVNGKSQAIPWASMEESFRFDAGKCHKKGDTRLGPSSDHNLDILSLFTAQDCWPVENEAGSLLVFVILAAEGTVGT